ncbi:MAG: hypothetical protein D3924_01700 [Candidatus Electrothrix sp. AR4]|nr:hypothetical protein [Candidatus Electrothrix sp. AR4]
MIVRISKLMTLAAFSGAIYWSYSYPKDVAAYIASILLFLPLVILFIHHYTSSPTLSVRTVELANLKPGKIPRLKFKIENIGEGSARHVQISTRVHITKKKLDNEPFPTLFKWPTRNSFLPRGKIMSQRLPFAKSVTKKEIKRINKEELFIYVYSVIRYKDEFRKIKKELRMCNLYDPKSKSLRKNLSFFKGSLDNLHAIGQPNALLYREC